MDGDANGDMKVDGTDFLIWQQQFTGSLDSLSSIATVPEPTSSALLACGVLWYVLGASRKRIEC